jgi:hypothetical protein
MKAPVLARLLATLLISCSGSIDTAETSSAGAERVFVEAVLARFDSNELALVRTLGMDQIITGNSPGLISTMGGITDQGVPLVLDPGAYAKAHAADSAEATTVALERLEVTPAITSDHAVRLDMRLKVSADGSQHSFTKADLFSGSQLLVWDTELKTRSGESIVMLVQPTLIETEQDLKRILERRSARSAPANP